MSRTTTALQIALICAALAMAGQAQPNDAADNRAGYLVLGIDQRVGGVDVDAVHRRQALAIASALRDLLQHDPAIATPRGFSARLHRAYGKRTDWGSFDSGQPFYAGVYGTLFPANVKPAPTHFSGPNFGIWANTVLACPMTEFTPFGAAQPWRLNGNLPVVQGGRRTGEIQGFEIYDGQCAIATRTKIPAFLPLTREQYATFQIAMRKDELKKVPSAESAQGEMRDAIESGTRQLETLIAKLEQELAKMSPSERQAPVAVRLGYGETQLADVADAGAVPLSVPNPAVFDQGLQGTAIQSIAVYIPFLQPGNRATGLPPGLSVDWRAVTEKIRDGLDWAALKALLDSNH
jgi:hypothetical protein